MHAGDCNGTEAPACVSDKGDAVASARTRPEMSGNKPNLANALGSKERSMRARLQADAERPTCATDRARGGGPRCKESGAESRKPERVAPNVSAAGPRCPAAFDSKGDPG